MIFCHGLIIFNANNAGLARTKSGNGWNEVSKLWTAAEEVWEVIFAIGFLFF